MYLKANCLSCLFCAMLMLLVSNILSIGAFDISPKMAMCIAVGIAVLATPTFWLIYRYYVMSRHNKRVANIMENTIIVLPVITIVITMVMDTFMGIPPSDGVRNAAIFAVFISLIPVLIICYDAIQRGIIKFPLKKIVKKEETHRVYIIESDGTLYTAHIKGNTILSKDMYYDSDGYAIMMNTERFE